MSERSEDNPSVSAIEIKTHEFSWVFLFFRSSEERDTRDYKVEGSLGRLKKVE
jgi:hypothetical protein